MRVMPDATQTLPRSQTPKEQQRSRPAAAAHADHPVWSTKPVSTEAGDDPAARRGAGASGERPFGRRRARRRRDVGSRRPVSGDGGVGPVQPDGARRRREQRAPEHGAKEGVTSTIPRPRAGARPRESCVPLRKGVRRRGRACITAGDPLRERYVWVCSNRPPTAARRLVPNRGARPLRELKVACHGAGLNPTVRVMSSSCLDLCEHGIALAVTRWCCEDGAITEADIPALVEGWSAPWRRRGRAHPLAGKVLPGPAPKP